ncbi:hypothetical protein [Desertivirga xinjiangensis]|uniref:hypothetical protein n=1 Tax=Desertivirga xinjiangensis TaxID=539206 RepID=UPI00210A86A1|nr:hypothetical protein [Pedobacter xinjiangensis]
MRFAAVIFTLVLFYSCGKDSSDIPYVPVDYRITVQEFGIRTSGTNGLLTVQGKGVAGLLIYKNAGTYVAYDRCSTVNPEKRCAVIQDPKSIFELVDTCSGAKFLLLDGSPVKAPAKRSLRQYSVSVSNNSLIQVSN